MNRDWRTPCCGSPAIAYVTLEIYVCRKCGKEYDAAGKLRPA